MRFLVFALVCFSASCGGRATDTSSEPDASGPAVVKGPNTGGGQADSPHHETGGDAFEQGGAPALSDDDPTAPEIGDVTRSTVPGCFEEAVLGACTGLENIVMSDLTWSIDEDDQLVVSGIAIGDDADYPCIGISPAHADEDEILGLSGGPRSHAIAQLYAVHDDFPTPITMSLSPQEPGDYQIVVWVSRLNHDCAAPVDVLSVTWE